MQRTREEKFRWDEENRLTALSQNGYVSHYWYDADGDRTVKMHGGSMAVFVNSERDGRSLGSQQTTAYFSPYFSIKDNCFAKHDTKHRNAIIVFSNGKTGTVSYRQNSGDGYNW